MNMKTIYRVRPCEDYTLDELRNSYLWFSKPTNFKDTDDANIYAFTLRNRPILRGLLAHYCKAAIKEWLKKFSYTGICCFTKVQPTKLERRHFPKCANAGICIEFDRKGIEDFFNNHPTTPISYCFKEVIYDDKPTSLESDGQWHILSWKDESGSYYESILSIILDPKKLEKFVISLLTRINSKFKDQKEERIILGGRNIDYKANETGYKINIPTELIKSVGYYSDTPQQFIDKMKNIESIASKLKRIDD